MRWMVCRAAPWWTDACEDGGRGGLRWFNVDGSGRRERGCFSVCGLIFFSLQSDKRLWDGLGHGRGYQDKLGMTMGIGKMG